ncbi:hypothetical protein N431DRAFT_436370 [Stipitochalara longipes BDJ]|nr:hypothetical protein N431DRAFT_436370 [Stipitochalara longipes BDJ]
MAKDLDDSTKTLGTFFCFVLIAYIFYTLGSWSSHSNSQVTLPSPCDQPCCRQGEAVTPNGADKPEPVNETTPKKADEKEIYKELTQSAKWYETFAVRALQETKEREKEMRRDLEKWDDERRLEMKDFREEQLRLLWASKRKEEKGGWFGVARRKK